MDQRKFNKRGRPRRRQRSRSQNLRQPINLMQLMRRRSRYRPYSVNNSNNRSAIPNISYDTSVNSRNNNRMGPVYFFAERENYPTYRLSRSRDQVFLRPLFNLFDSLETQDMGVNTEMPCCVFHPSYSATENIEADENLYEFDMGDHEEAMLLEDNELQDHVLNSMESLENTHENNISQYSGTENQISSSAEETKNVPNNFSTSNNQQPNSLVTLAATKSNDSKSQEDSSTEASGSSISYTERDRSSRKQNLSDITFLEVPTTLEELNYGDPQIQSHMQHYERNSPNSLVLIEGENFEENTRIEPSTSSLMHKKETESFFGKYSSINDYPNHHVNKKSLLNLNELSDSHIARKTSSESTQFKKSSSENFNLKNSFKTDNRGSEQSFSQNLSNNNSNIMSNMEFPQSSSDSLDLTAKTTIAYVEVHSNTSTENNASGSSLNNEEDQTTIAATDTEAGGDGHHNDSVIHIEFTVTATINPDNQDNNADDEGEESNNETNGEEEDRDNEDI